MRQRRFLGALVMVLALSIPGMASAQGLILPSAGVINTSMGGASTAAPIDAIGAIYWNPASISGLGRSEVGISSGLVYPSIHASSTLSVPDFKNGGPPRVFSGETRSDSGVAAIPTIGMVYQEPNSDWTFGFGLLAIAGGNVNFPGQQGNPIFTRPLGATWASTNVLQLGGFASYRVTERLAVGVGPTVDLITAGFNPAPIAPPNSNGTFSPAINGRPFWGGGFAAGVFYNLTDDIDVGFSFKSPQWLESWKWNTRDGEGLPRTITLNASLPAILSWGVGYHGIDNLLLAADVRYFGYRNTDFFGAAPNIAQAGYAQGLGWRDVFSLALGAQYAISENFSVRVGYQYNTNPIEELVTIVNIESPAILQHNLCLGASAQLTDSIGLGVAYVHSFQNSITGPIGELVHANTTLSAAADSLVLGLIIQFGKPSGTTSQVATTSSSTQLSSLPGDQPLVR